jgi:hypothetical protein
VINLKPFLGLWIVKCFALIWTRLWRMRMETKAVDRAEVGPLAQTIQQATDASVQLA